ncbi:MAG: hypothetical protein IKG87_05225, partial [Clostridia bacterium]|nr:hypothetical protein [Clostridia bacterium]
PGEHYLSAGGYKPGKVASAEALVKDGDYVLVHLDYPTGGGKKCVYFKSSEITKQPDLLMETEPYTVTVSKDTQPKLGPGDAYMKGELSGLKKGTSVSAVLEWKGWLLVEYTEKKGLVRAWIPLNSIQ